MGWGGNSMTSASLDAIFGSTRGQILVRGASAWAPVNLGAANTVVSSDGTDTKTQTITALLDAAFGSTRGMSLVRGASTWGTLAVPVSGNVIGSDGTDLVSKDPTNITQSALTAGTMTVTNSALSRSVITRFDWTNAMVVALGGAVTGDITVCTLPAKTVVQRVWVVVTGQGAGVTTLTVAVGRTAAGYIDYIVASDAKAAANTLYGGAAVDLGTNLTGYDLPSVTGTTAVKAHFISTIQNLSSTTGSSGSIYILTTTLP